MESEADTLLAKKKVLKCTTNGIISQCSSHAESVSRFATFVKEEVSERFQPLALVFENMLKK